MNEIEYTVEPIPSKTGKEFIIKNHYAHGCHNGPTCYGLFHKSEMIGVLAFATPASENVRRSVFGSDYASHVIELHRLVVLDSAPQNTESWFITQCLREHKQRKPHVWAVVSFADSTEGHVGVIYQATNAIYYGMSSEARFWKDEKGRLRHPRQCGVNITNEMGKERGWTAVKRKAKHRYVFLTPDNKKHKRFLQRILQIQPQPYPKTEQDSKASRLVASQQGSVRFRRSASEDVKRWF